MTITLAELLKDSAYKLSQFKPEHIAALQAGITLKDAAKKPTPYFTCLVRGKPISLTPEERAVEIAIEESEDAALAHLQLVVND